MKDITIHILPALMISVLLLIFLMVFYSFGQNCSNLCISGFNLDGNHVSAQLLLNGEPLENANVQLVLNNAQTADVQTDANGYLSFYAPFNIGENIMFVDYENLSDSVKVGYYADLVDFSFIAIGLLVYLTVKKLSDVNFLNKSLYVRLSNELPSVRLASIPDGEIKEAINDISSSNEKRSATKDLPINASELKKTLLVRLHKGENLDENAIDEEVYYALKSGGAPEKFTLFNGILTNGEEPYVGISSKLVYEEAVKNGGYSIEPTKRGILEKNNIHTVETLSSRSLKKSNTKTHTVMIFDSRQMSRLQKKLYSNFPGNASFLLLSCIGKLRCYDARTG